MCKKLLGKLKRLVNTLNKFNAENSKVENNQVQKAGDGSQQIQMVNSTLNIGISEERAREIFTEMNAIARQNYTCDAYERAIKRVEMFEELLMDKVNQVDGMLEAFRDPSFQILLVEAQKRAAASDRDADLQMLAELLVHRVENKDDRKIKASISGAINIVDQIDDDALCGLTLVYAISNLVAVSGDISQGLNDMNNLFSSLCYRKLPTEFEWVYHLDILNAVRSSSLVTFKKFKDYYTDMLNGYVCVGIQKNSENHSKALEILRDANLPLELLVAHELNNGFVRLNVQNKELISNIEFFAVSNAQVVKRRRITAQEVSALDRIWNLYSQDANIIENVRNTFMAKWNTYESLSLIRAWWEKIPHSFVITPIGRALAHANAKRYNNNVPDMSL